MSFTNSYKQDDSPLQGYYGPDPYDINWIMPLHQTTLESDRVKLTPFIPSLYAKSYADQVKAHPDIHRYYPLDLTSLDKILLEIEILVRRRPAYILFAIIDKARGDALAGLIGLFGASPTNLSVEISWVMVFPEFRRSYVTSNAVGLMLNYCLELPTAPAEHRGPGLGFRRVQWAAHPENQASIALAKRMGFKEEGLMRLTQVVFSQGDGIPLHDGDPNLKSSSPGWHSVMLSLCADDWENGARELVRHMIDRQ